MQKQGKGAIVATVNCAGLGRDYELAPYCASKAGIINLCRVLALDHAKDDIKVNALCPGYMMTPMTNHLNHSLQQSIMLPEDPDGQRRSSERGFESGAVSCIR
jgi:NAD(P)-dependent dehydrogenase (short-subunit alcohol dehydrogenase family)